jgi:hypothetical protein
MDIKKVLDAANMYGAKQKESGEGDKPDKALVWHILPFSH